MPADTEKPRPRIAAMERGPGPVYSLPSTLGLTGHTPTKKLAPAYSMGNKSKLADKERSPGPCYNVAGGPTITGKAGTPSYTMRPKYNPPRSDLKPAPGAYAPENTLKATTRKDPAYSMGTKLKTDIASITPPPNSYSFPALLGSKNVNSNGRTSPCFTMSGKLKTGGVYHSGVVSPGPGVYALNDSIKRKAPSYSMRLKCATNNSELSPGPAIYSISKDLTTPKGKTFGVRHSEYVLQPMSVATQQ